MRTECPWPIDLTECCEPTSLNPEDPNDAKRIKSIIAQVSAMMTTWSGGAIGGCATVRPLDPCGECRSGCCASGDCVQLHDAAGVTEVRLNGEVVPEVQYHYDPDQGTLCAVPPLHWPTRDPRFENVGSLEVDTLVGRAPDAWALAVATELACELVLSCTDQKCRLPRNATTVSSQGITIQLKPDELLYSIPSVMAWVAAVNPHKAVMPARIFSPEARSFRSTLRASRFAPWSR